MTRLGIVVLGASGYMASQGLAALCSIKDRMRDSGVAIELLTLVDPMLFSGNEDVTLVTRQKARHFMTRLNRCGMDITSKLAVEDIVDRAANGADLPEIIIFYDATGTQYHAQNFHQIHDFGQSGFVYFGEKPIFNDIAGMRSMVSSIGHSQDYFCDFIETENPVVCSIREYIAKTDLVIDEMRFWRSGSSGLKHLVGHDQSGVEGGAWLDKAPHDLSIAYSLLSPEAVVGFCVREARFLELIPCPGSALRFLPAYKPNETVYPDGVVYPSQLDFSVRAQTTRLHLPADGLTSAHFNLRLYNGRKVPVHVLTGWTGCHGMEGESFESDVERTFTQTLRDLGVARREWLFSERFDGRSKESRGSCIETQARIMILDGHIGERMVRIAASLIHADADPALDRKALDRWARVYVKKGETYHPSQELEFELAPTYGEQKLDDLRRIFERVIRATVERTRDDALSRDAVNMVHRMLLRAHDRAIAFAMQENFADPDRNRAAANRVSRAVRIS